MNIYDVHTHLRSLDVDSSKIIERLDAANIYAANLFSVSPRLSDYEERIDSLLKITKNYPNRLFPILFIHPDEESLSSKIDDALARGVMGFKMICNNYYVYEDKCMKVLEQIAASGKPVLFHSGILWGGEVSAKYNRPINWECCLKINGLRFSLAHCSWPWYDECLAVYGKFLNAYSKTGALSAEMFLDMTPGTPEIYREDLITKLLTIGYDIKNNLLFGTDCTAETYNVDWCVKWQNIDNRIYDKLSVDEETRAKIYGENMKRFMGFTKSNITYACPLADGTMVEAK